MTSLLSVFTPTSYHCVHGSVLHDFVVHTFPIQFEQALYYLLPAIVGITFHKVGHTMYYSRSFVRSSLFQSFQVLIKD